MDSSVATIGSVPTAVRATTPAICIRRILRCQVALLRAVHDCVTTVASKRTVGVASAVGTVIDAIVAVFVGIDDAVAAMDATIHVTQASFVSVVDSVIALLAGVDFAVSARDERNPANAARHT